MSDDKILSRIQKLLNLSTSANANEAAAAMAKAQVLMAEYAVTELDVRAADLREVEIKSTQSISRPKDWEVRLVTMITKAFGVAVMWQPGHSRNEDYWGRHILLGTKAQVPLAEYAVIVLLRQLVKERAAFSKVLTQQGYRRGKVMTAQLDGFCKGWLNTVKAKVHVFANTPEVQELIDARIDKICGGGTTETKSRGNGAAGWYAGETAAKDVEINRPMEAEERLQLEGK